MKHTPGPWDAERDDRRERYDIGHRRMDMGQRVVATVSFGYDEPAETEQHANAALISTAPELLALLDELDGSFDQQTYQEKSREDFDAPDDREYSVNITAKQLREINRVILKATRSAEKRTSP